MQVLSYFVFGLVTGSILLLGTVGFSMIRRIDNFLNIAHGQMLALGAYIGYVFYMKLHLPILLATLVTVACGAVIGLGLYKLVFEPMRRRGPLYLLLASVGLAYVISGMIEVIFGTTPKSYIMPKPSFITFNGRPLISSVGVLIIVVSLLSAVGLHLFLTRTTAGLSVRAMSGNYDLAQTRGINTRWVASFVWLLASAMASLAGVLIAIRGTAYSDMGWAMILPILAAAVLGGLGRIYGVMIGAFLIGLSMDMSVMWIKPSYRAAVAFVVVMVVLAVRPRGIFGGASNG